MSILQNGGGTPPREHGSGYYPGLSSGSEDEAGGELTVGQALATIRRRWWLVVLCVAIVFAGAWKMVPPDQVTYRATAVVRLEDGQSALTGSLTGGTAGGVGPSVRSPEYIMSQIHIIQSRAVVGAAVDREGLRVLPNEGIPGPVLRDVAIEGEQTATTVHITFEPEGYTASADGQQVTGLYGEPAVIQGVQFTIAQNPGTGEATLQVIPRDLAINLVTASLTAAPRPRSAILDIDYVDRDPFRARRVANAVAHAYAEDNVRAVQEAYRRRSDFIERQWAQAEATRVRAEQAMIAFRDRTHPYSSGERLRAEQTSVMALDAERDQLDRERRVLTSFLNRVGQGGQGDVETALRTLLSTPGTTSSPLLSQLYSDLSRYQSERASLIAGGASPDRDDVRRLETLIRNTQASVIETAQTQIAAVELRISVLDDQRQRSAATIRSLPQTEEARLAHELEVAQGMATTLRSEYQRSLMSEGVNVGQVSVLDAATAATPVVRAGRTQKLSIAIFFGLMLGSGGALLLEASNTSVRRRQEVESQLAVPGLGVIPRIVNGNAPPASDFGFVKRWSTHSRKPVATGTSVQQQYNSSAGEAYRKLRTNLVFLKAAEQLKALVVTSASSGEGKTTTAANLAVAFARHGRRVLLVDCDLRRPRLHEIFGTEKSPGFIDLLLDRASGAEVVRPTTTEHLYFMPRGEFDERAAEALGTARMDALMTAFREHYDLVIFDTSPVLLTADAPAVAALADGVLLVVRAGRTPRAAVRQTQQQLEVVGAEVLGFVLNDPDAIASRYGEHEYATEYYAVEA